MAKYLKKPKTNIAMNIAMALFCLTLATTYLVSGLYARYTSSATGSDSARVMKFGNLTLTETCDFIEGTTMRVIPGIDLKKEAVVTFTGSEAATYVFVKVGLSDGWTTQDNKTFKLGDMLTWTIDDDWEYLAESEYVFFRTVAPNAKLTADVIKDGKVVVGETIATTSDSITITFKASVVQANGFDSVEAAWASLQTKEVQS
jgi:hypothetical protein